MASPSLLAMDDSDYCVTGKTVRDLLMAAIARAESDGVTLKREDKPRIFKLLASCDYERVSDGK